MKERVAVEERVLNRYKKGTWIVILVVTLLLAGGCSSTQDRGFAYIAEEDDSYALRGRNHELILAGINRHFIFESTNNYNNMSPVEFLDMARNHGIQIIRVFIPEGWPINICDEKGFEWPLGHYSEEFLEELDKVFLAARERDIYIILVLFDAFKYSVCWEKTVYAQLGEYKHDFFAEGEMREAQRKRVQFLVARYKDEPSLLAWEPINEIKNVAPKFFDANRREAVAMMVCWFEDMAETIREIDRQHLITQSIGGGVTIDELFRSPYLDILQPHLWYERFDPEQAVDNLRDYVARLRGYKKPIIIGEFASEVENPRRYEFIESFLSAAKEEGVPALLWTNKGTHLGGMDETIFGVYRWVYKK
jgi:endo-1,4-beta-mannosidase